MSESKERVLRLLLLLLARPYQYKKSDLAKLYHRDEDTIKGDFKAMRNVELKVVHDKLFRYAILPDYHFKELQYLQPLSEGEIANIRLLVQKQYSKKEALYLNRKLDSLYDFQRLGLQALRKPALDILDQLEHAKKNKKQITLLGYRSNSNSVRDRSIEAFHIDPELDTIQAYDVEVQKHKHFLLSRVERVQLTDKTWQYENVHSIKPTDVFRIVDDQQTFVHLGLDVYAYNMLTEAFPRARGAILPGRTPNTFDFQAKVNADFLGLLNFIMANFEHIDIYAPDRLKAMVIAKAQRIYEKLHKI